MLAIFDIAAHAGTSLLAPSALSESPLHAPHPDPLRDAALWGIADLVGAVCLAGFMLGWPGAAAAAVLGAAVELVMAAFGITVNPIYSLFLAGVIILLACAQNRLS